MKTQVFVMHGGHARNSDEEYLEYLRTKEVSLARLQQKDWKMSLPEKLGDGYDVFFFSMPNKENAKYAEWKIWFERFLPFFEDGAIFVGHSLGGLFLAKYFSENEYKKAVGGVFLVAPAFNTPSLHPRADFNILGPLTKLEEQVQKIFIYFSKDDQIVPFSNFESYIKELPNAEGRVFEDRGHFNIETFPEIVEDIQSIGN